ncbi:MAG: hypothetical protein IKQ22_00660 [Clostridia bacterium]|nr:hypothetical protein [Clostridia bacterium]
MTKAEIVDTMKKTWTEKLQQKEASLTDSILNGYTNWVQGLVKQVTEQQAVKAKQSQPAPQQIQQTPSLQGGAA